MCTDCPLSDTLDFTGTTVDLWRTGARAGRVLSLLADTLGGVCPGGKSCNLRKGLSQTRHQNLFKVMINYTSVFPVYYVCNKCHEH